MITSKIIGTGGYLPKKILTNDDLTSFLDTSDEWIKERTGIRKRHIAQTSLGETCSGMGLKASLKALEMANIAKEDLDMIILSSILPDYRMPNAASILQEALGVIDIPCFDISAACAGSIYGLNIAHSFIKSGQHRNILFVASEIMSQVVSWEDRNTAVLFGDGASACILSSSLDKDKGFIDFKLYADGRRQKAIFWEKSGSSNPIDIDAIKNKLDKATMNGREVYKFAVRSLGDAALDMLKRNNLSPKDIALVVPHQANLRIIEAISERVFIPLDRFLINLDKCANTSAASLMLVYDEALRNNRIKSGDTIMMMAIGSGFLWGTGLYRA